jgi:hypothetical protein
MRSYGCCCCCCLVLAIVGDFGDCVDRNEGDEDDAVTVGVGAEYDDGAFKYFKFESRKYELF